ncbi:MULTISPECIES: DNA mismatch repair protein MutS [Bacillus]|uniref:DNA mismatch repair protein MutS n=1 Tax=Bacillus TaxID=1386 RepID=UPI0002D45811|nr:MULTISPECIES: DNA mismatch repair protein MutS [Bacillus]
MATYTPMIMQYLQVKADYQDAFLFFRLGDFYEMFFDDAIKASQELEITLTSREGGTEEKIPMCGVPYHSAANYIDTLIEKGFKVAICEQVEDPRQAKGVVRREVVQLVTPGTVMQGRGIDEKENNYVTSITLFEDHTFGFAFADLSTGENKVTLLSNSFQDVLNEVTALAAKEVVISNEFPEELRDQLKERHQIVFSMEDDIFMNEDIQKITTELNQEKLIITTSRLLHYLFKTQKRSLDHIQPTVTYETDHYLKIDYHSKRNLELTETIRSKGKNGSLLWLLDETKTAMGARMLKQWIDRPLLSKESIANRHGIVEVLLENYFNRQELRESLKEVYDLERLSGRVAFGNVNARDLIALKKSLQQVPHIINILAEMNNSKLQEIIEQLDPCEEVADLLEQSLLENPPLAIKEGNMIKDGYDQQLDEYRDASRNGKTWIASLEKQERDLTGIKSLKIGYNRVFGYYIEVTKANIHLLEEGRYERKQTLTNAERYITPELKEKESLILEAEEKMVELEYSIFTTIREHVKEYIPRLQALAKCISSLDVLQCFATVSENRHYTKPLFSDDRKIHIVEGRHPVVEKVMQKQQYVPNDCFMNTEREMLLITGPNMSGKSTYMRQVALMAVLAQIGCFVPAERAELPIFDQIFTRIGAADDLISGQSTFMVEMLEANHAIAHATQNSLILFDEIGRGTSTYDGMALAQAIIEYIHEKIGAKTLFSTHYHELTTLENSLHQLKNVHVSAIEQNGKVVFLHKIKEGAADKSYGIHVAQLADLPNDLIQRANELLQQFESDKPSTTSVVVANGEIEIASAKKSKEAEAQLSFFEPAIESKKDKLHANEHKCIQQLKALNILEMTPLDAMNALYELQKKANQ